METFKCIDRVTWNSSVIYDYKNKYVGELISHKAEIELYGSPNVQKAYENFIEYVYNLNKAYCDYLDQSEKHHNDENDKGGNLMPGEVDILVDQDMELYEENHPININRLKMLVQHVQDAMREDLKN